MEQVEYRRTGENGGHHGEETRKLAYQVWAFVAGRDSRKTRHELQRTYGVDVPDRTIRDWSRRYEWATHVLDDLRAIAPDIRGQTVVELIFGGLEGARCLRRAVREDVLRDERPGRDEVTAAVALLDRAGFSPLNRAPAPDVPVTRGVLPESVDVAALSVDELLQLQGEMLDKLRADRESAASRWA